MSILETSGTQDTPIDVDGLSQARTLEVRGRPRARRGRGGRLGHRGGPRRVNITQNVTIESQAAGQRITVVVGQGVELRVADEGT